MKTILIFDLRFTIYDSHASTTVRKQRQAWPGKILNIFTVAKFADSGKIHAVMEDNAPRCAPHKL